MADEIKVQTIINVVNGTFKESFNPGQISVDQTAVGLSGGIFSVGTSEETITFVDITTEGWIWMQNLDASNYVEWGAVATTPTLASIGRLEAGEHATFRMEPGTSLGMKANTAAVDVMIKLLED